LRGSAERDATPQRRFSSAAHRLPGDLIFDNTGDLPLYAGNSKQPQMSTGRLPMTLSRRRILVGALAAPAVIATSRLGSAAPAHTFKISHQFPGGSIDEGDFRDRLCRKFAVELEKRTNGDIVGQVYPNSSLMKTVAQFSAMRKGALDLSLYPISYAGGEAPETNIGLMPGLVSSYKQGAAWKTSPVGQKFTAYLEEKGIVIVSWIWQAGGVASRGAPIVNPADVKGIKIRGGSREMDMVFQAAGATTLNTPSNELYAAMQTGACDACTTSSTSLISFRLEEVAKSLTTGRGKSYWFMLEPLVMSKQIFDPLSKSQKDAIMAIGLELESFGTKEAMADDEKVAEVYAKKGAKVADLDEAIVDKWRAIARDTAWKDYAARSPLAAELIKLAESVHVS
jgi:TRAP-type C4-dicarboxylate transport system substrate-binding protein